MLAKLTKLVKETEEVNKFGRIRPCMKDTGRTTKPTEEEDVFILTGIYMKDNGRIIWLTVRDSVYTTMAPAMKANGSKMSKKALVLKNGLMGLLTKGNILTIFSQHDNGKKHGYGKFIFADKSSYEGEFHSNII